MLQENQKQLTVMRFYHFLVGRFSISENDEKDIEKRDMTCQNVQTHKHDV